MGSSCSCSSRSSGQSSNRPPRPGRPSRGSPPSAPSPSRTRSSPCHRSPLASPCRRVEQGVAVLGDEEEQQPVDQAQQRPVVVVPAHLAGGQPVAQPGVGRVLQEAGAQLLQRPGHPVAQRVQGAGALLHGEAAPPLQPAAGRARRTVLPHWPVLQPRLMEQGVQQDEVGVQLPVEDGLQVELDVGRADQRGGVAQDAQQPPVGEHPPQVVVAAVEALLQHRLGRGPGRAGRARGTPVQVDPPAEQVDRDALPQVADRVGPVPGGDPAGGGQPAVAEFAEQQLQPPFPGERGGPVGLGQLLQLVAEGAVRAEQVGPGAAGGVAEPLAGGEVVVGRGVAGQGGVPGGDAGEQVGGEQPADDPDGGEPGAWGGGGGGHLDLARMRRPSGRGGMGLITSIFESFFESFLDQPEDLGVDGATGFLRGGSDLLVQVVGDAKRKSNHDTMIVLL